MDATQEEVGLLKRLCALWEKHKSVLAHISPAMGEPM
jgi:hypothetical protein